MINTMINFLDMNNNLKITLKKSIMEHLQSGNPLTVMSCFKLLYTNELRHFISELKNDGLDIKSHWEYSADKRKKWKKYYI